MAWFKVDDRIFSSPAWVKCSRPARALWVTAGAYSAAYATEGAIPRAAIQMLGGSLRYARDLVDAGLWQEFDGGGEPHLAGWKFTDLYCAFDFGDNRATIPLSVRAAVIERDGFTCGLCGGAVEPGDVHLDHIQPVSLGGKNSSSNLQVAHSRCNLRKGNRI